MMEKQHSVSKLTKWLGYTVFIGLIPILLRLLTSYFTEGVATTSAADFIAVGFVLHISIFNELEHMDGDQTWKSISNIISIGMVAIYGALMLGLLIVESGYNGININLLTDCAMKLAIASFILCFIIFFRLTAKEKAEKAVHKGQSEGIVC
ncbi:hypothetical protein PVK64_00045 [Aliivibrio sp. S4TY2]|uniref:hypothetical protein n=1 Tax=unclassified Aliivibrio TaxID=2645654 RepID=UPI0023790207|nr:MULTISPECIES: hypothetical protein [unclassified Aliivibrio]MDD9154577.1 hypothetical protein [Aliivibrio sp. S4TY2]MDD9159060.1 hypothetical protein [Aliivibrio sp. S4TY1]MDD9162580.1 hypothetical protein [Aliivibrio sp. S4MY2]MDD9167059.1 hypothetical protein [Aliivibrio sp. S4MY4]MDD9183657.1 hypothetical protein [Aliivibrio sp. S4MY3]